MSNRHTEAYKRMVVEQYGRVSAAELCKQYGIARSTLFLWVKQYTKDQTGQIPRETYLLQKEVERLRAENQIFKVCGCSPASPLSDRLAAIEANQEEFSIHALCRALDVNRSTYYYHVLCAPEVTQLQAEDDQLKPVISEIFEKSAGRFGARKIRVKLVQDGYSIAEYIDMALTGAAFQSALSARKEPSDLIFHSDQGAQYTSFEFRTLLRCHGVTQSFSAPGCPYDNAVAESFFASIKKEDFRRNFYKSEEEFRAAVDSYIDFYNDYRPHQRLGYPLMTGQMGKEKCVKTTGYMY